MNEISDRAILFVESIRKFFPGKVEEVHSGIGGLRWRGSYKDNESYRSGDIVNFQNNLWFCLSEVYNVRPSESSMWTSGPQQAARPGSYRLGPGIGAIIYDAERGEVIVTFSDIPTGTFNDGITYTVDGGGDETFASGVAGPGPYDVTYTASSDFVFGEVVLLSYVPGDIEVGDTALEETQNVAVDNQIIQVPIFFPDITPDSFSLIQGQEITPYDLDLLNYQTGGQVVSFASIGTALPANLVLDTNTGIISGAAVNVGTTVGVQFRGTNTSGSDDSNEFDIIVSSTLQPPTYDGVPIDDIDAFAGGQMGPISVASHWAAGEAVNSYSLIGAPVWMSIDGNGDIYGIPPTAGTFSGITVRATNAAGSSDSTPTFSVIAVEITVILHLPLADATGLIDFEGTN